MKKLSFEKTLAEATGQKTYPVTLKSKKTGNEYNTQAFDAELIALGKPEKVEKILDDGSNSISYRYEIFDAVNDLGYRISAPIEVKTGTFTKLIFRQVIGGSTGNGGYWLKCKSVEVPPKKV